MAASLCHQLSEYKGNAFGGLARESATRR